MRECEQLQKSEQALRQQLDVSNARLAETNDASGKLQQELLETRQLLRETDATREHQTAVIAQALQYVAYCQERIQTLEEELRASAEG